MFDLSIIYSLVYFSVGFFVHAFSPHLCPSFHHTSTRLPLLCFVFCLFICFTFRWRFTTPLMLLLHICIHLHRIVPTVNYRHVSCHSPHKVFFVRPNTHMHTQKLVLHTSLRQHSHFPQKYIPTLRKACPFYTDIYMCVFVH